MLHTLKFDFSKVSFKDQLIKVSEELGEVIKADSGKEWNLRDELGDLILASYGLARTMFSEEETQALIRDCIEKVNARVTGNKPSVLLLKSCCVCGKEFQVHDCEDDSVLAPVEYTCPKCSESTDIA